MGVYLRRDADTWVGLGVHLRTLSLGVKPRRKMPFSAFSCVASWKASLRGMT